MNFLQILLLAFTIIENKGGSFVVTIGSKHLSVSITDQGSNGPVTGFSFSAALAIAEALIAGQPGVIDVRVGADVYAVTVALIEAPSISAAPVTSA